MRKLILSTSAVLFMGFIAFAQEVSYSDKLKLGNRGVDSEVPQELRFTVRGNYSRPVLKDNLKKANNLGDIISYYPVNWITQYVSTELSLKTNGKVLKAEGSDDVLTSRQKELLQTVQLGSEIDIKVHYKARNSVTGVIEAHTMNVVMTVVPEVEAEYAGGHDQIRKYLQEAAIDKINSNEIKPAIVSFTVNEVGAAINAIITKSTGNPKTDKLLIEVVTRMPKWKSAKNSKGKKVKQDFVFLIEMGGC